MKFVTLHTERGDVCVNFDLVYLIEEGPAGAGATLRTMGTDDRDPVYIFTKETPEEILALIKGEPKQ